MDKKVIVFGVDGFIPELVYKFSNEGYLPNISRMLSEGASTELLPYISAWGDVNWVSFLSGQSPGTSWKGQGVPPENENNLLGYMQKNSKRCALVHFPESLSARGTDHFEFAPFWSRKGGAPFELAPAALHTTCRKKWRVKEKKEFLGWPPVGTLAYHEKHNLYDILEDEQGLHLVIPFHHSDEETALVRPINDEEILLEFRQGFRIRLRLHEWSEWVTVPFSKETGVVRFRLLDYDRHNRQVDILQSQINRTHGFSNDPLLERKLLETCGPFISKWTVKADPDEPYAETSFDEGEYQAYWLAQAALTLINEHDFDVFATVYRLPDETQHHCLGEYDPASSFYSPERAGICESFIRRSYEIVDRAIGKILNEKSERTLLILASDHGNVPNAYFCDIYRRLEQCGLCKLDAQGNIVLNESKAYLKSERGGLEVYVNLQGREKSGIIPLDQYEQVQTEIFQALSTWYYQTPKGLQNVVGIVLKKQDAEVIGYRGEEMGDVIFAYSPGFVWGNNKKGDVVAPVSAPSANHGPQIPSAATRHSSNFGIAVFHGPNIHQGVRLNRNEPYRMNDVGTTIAKLIGIEYAPGLDGKVMYKLLTNESRYI